MSRLLEYWVDQFGDAEDLLELLPADQHPVPGRPETALAAAKYAIGLFRSKFVQIASALSRREPVFAGWYTDKALPLLGQISNSLRISSIEDAGEAVALVRHGLGLLPGSDEDEHAWTWCMESLAELHTKLEEQGLWIQLRDLTSFTYIAQQPDNPGSWSQTGQQKPDTRPASVLTAAM